jgi:cytidylate kinase
MLPFVNPLIVTVDGPGGTGKSTVSREVAERAGLPHLDTGAFYRAATLAVLEAGADPSSAAEVTPIVAGLHMAQEDGRMYLDGRDVSEEIRGEDVTASVSAVSAHPEVRAILVGEQRSWVAAHGRRAVVEGRDIGSVVFPDAEVKVFLDASAQVRAARRARQTGESLSEVLDDLNRRDRLDSTRATSPMTVPEGAVVLDTSDLGFEEVVDRLLGLISAKS